MEILVIAPILWLALGVAGAMIMSSKGRSGCAGFAFGVILGPIGLVIALLFQFSVEHEADRLDRIERLRLERRPFDEHARLRLEAEDLRRRADEAKHFERIERKRLEQQQSPDPLREQEIERLSQESQELRRRAEEAEIQARHERLRQQQPPPRGATETETEAQRLRRAADEQRRLADEAERRALEAEGTEHHDR